jgi:hypothetical protein
MPASRLQNPKELSEWIGRESHMPGPAQVMTDEADVAGALKESIAGMRRARQPRFSRGVTKA